KKWAGPALVERKCSDCEESFEIETDSRKELVEAKKLYTPYVKYQYCPKCQRKSQTTSNEWIEELKKQEEQRKQRLQELRTMPYRDYLLTPEWQERRKRHMKQAGYRCQICNAYKVRLNVHHRTYERRGNEAPGDLI